MATQNQLNPNAPPYLPLPPAKILTRPYYRFHVIPTNCQLITYFPQPPALLPAYSRDGAEDVKVGPMVHAYPLRSSTCVSRHRNGTFVNELAFQTVMIRNIPNQLSRQKMLEFLDKLCYSNNIQPSPKVRCEYDFVYLPFDFRSGHNLGYAFVNFTSSAAAQFTMKTLDGYMWASYKDSSGCSCETKKICQVTWARIQGKENLLSRFRKTMFGCYTADFLPVILSPPRDGITSSSPPFTVGKHIVPHK